MENFGLFFNSFFNYIILMLIIVAVCSVGFILGRVLRKKKDSKVTLNTANEE